VSELQALLRERLQSNPDFGQFVKLLMNGGRDESDGELSKIPLDNNHVRERHPAPVFE
jgi:hypothetical protein